VRPERLVGQDAVQHRSRQFLRAGGRRVAVEELLRLDHQRAKLLAIARFECLHRLVHDALVDRAEQLLHARLGLVIGEGIGAIEPGQNLHRVLLRQQVHQHEIESLAGA